MVSTYTWFDLVLVGTWGLVGWLAGAGLDRWRARGPSVDAPPSIFRWGSLAWWSALSAGGIAWRELTEGGRIWAGTSLDWFVTLDEQGRWTLAAYHSLLLLGLLAGAQRESRGAPWSARAAALIAMTGIVPPLLVPALQPFIAFPTLREHVGEQAWLLTLMNLGFGAATGLIMGLLAATATGEGRGGERGRATGIAALVGVGIFLGWQAVSGIAACAALGFTIVILYRPALVVLRSVPFVGLVWFSTFAWLLGWWHITTHWPLWGESGDHRTLIVTGGTVLVTSLVGWLFRGRPELLPELRAPNPPDA